MRVGSYQTFSKNKLWLASQLILAGLFLFSIIPLPKPLFDVPYVTTLSAKDGTLLSASIAKDQQWRFPPSDSVSQKIKISFLLLEDEYFYHHPGINPVSLIRAISQNIKANKIVSGGSTITMQTVRMSYGNQPRTYGQKFLELLSALKLEMINDKATIFKSYVDHAPFGGNIVGIKAASWRYFGRPPYLLSWAEAATLAVLPNDPAGIYPGRNQKLLLNKRNRLLQKIMERGYITEDELFLAQQESLPQQVRELPDHAYHLLHRGIREGHQGEEIGTTLDAQLQVHAQQKVTQYSAEMDGNQIHNAAALILDIASGNVLAYVGNSNNEGNHGQHVDIITSRRSPGSLLKPFLYAAALDDALISPQELLPDIPIFYKGFAPKNFDKNYRGAVHADDALVSSLNVPFVHLLIDYGYERFHQKLNQLGFHSIDQPAGHYGLSIILGGAETTLWELTGAYAGMARALQKYQERPFRSGYSDNDYHENNYLLNKDHKDEQLASNGYLLAPSINYTFSAMQRLHRPNEESGWERFQSSRQIAWKTGTSYGFRDGWAIGLNDKYLVGVWLGNADGEGRPGLTGVRAAAPLLFELFDLLDGSAIKKEEFGMPVSICTASGMPASASCQLTNTILLADYMTKASQCSYHQMLHLNHEGDKQVNSSCYEVADIRNQSWFVLPPVQSWYYQQYHPDFKKLPPFDANCQGLDDQPLFDLIYPSQFAKIHIPVEQDGLKGLVIFEAAHENKQSIIYWHLDNEYLGWTQGTHQKGIATTIGHHQLTLVDESGAAIKQGFEVVN